VSQFLHHPVLGGDGIGSGRKAGLRGVNSVVAIFLAFAMPCAAALAQVGAQALPAVVTPPGQAVAVLGGAQLEQLVGPVALYPDQVLTDILAAATTPAEVVEAARFVADPAHAEMDGAALTEAASAEDWDPSVKALLMFPQALQMMDAKLDWTEHLGRAFITQQADVMNTVQQLREAAEQAGRLTNGPYAAVVNEGGDIAIEPTSTQDFFLPIYQPDCVFGTDSACATGDDEIFWGADVVLPYGFAQWGIVDWRQRDIRLSRPAHARIERLAGNLETVWRPAVMPGLPSGSFTFAAPAPTHFVQRRVAPAYFHTAPVLRAPGVAMHR